MHDHRLPLLLLAISVRVCVEVTTNNDPDQATDDCQLFTYFDD